jgi:hypothetical protein
MFGLAATDMRDLAVDADRPRIHQRLCVLQTGVHGVESVGVVRQLTVEVGTLGNVVPDSPGGAEPAQCPKDPILRETGVVAEACDVDAWLEGQQRRHQVGVIGGVLVGQVPQDPTLAREAAAGLRAQCEHQSCVIELQLPHAGGSLRVVGRGVGAHRPCESQHGLQRLEPVESRE